MWLQNLVKRISIEDFPCLASWEVGIRPRSTFPQLPYIDASIGNWSQMGGRGRISSWNCGCLNLNDSRHDSYKEFVCIWCMENRGLSLVKLCVYVLVRANPILIYFPNSNLRTKLQTWCRILSGDSGVFDSLCRWVYTCVTTKSRQNTWLHNTWLHNTWTLTRLVGPSPCCSNMSSNLIVTDSLVIETWIITCGSIDSYTVT